MKFEYPTESITDENACYSIGGTNSFGFYPISRFNTWHGGIHIEGLQGIHAIADGTVIAYRLPKIHTKEVIEETTYLYSNGFVLIQHPYKSPKGAALTFYSLYMHLLPYQQVINRKLLTPSIFTKRGNKEKGLRARDAKNSKIRYVLPKGQEVSLNENISEEERSATHWTQGKDYKKYDFKKVKFKDLNGKWHTEIYISTLEQFVETLSGNKLKIKSDGTEEYPPEAYTFNVKPDQLDRVICCNIPVKAGSLVGYTGRYAFERQPIYTAAHLEVFTPDDVASFIKNTREDGDKEKKYLKVKIGAVLNKAYPGKIVSDSNVKVEDGDTYSRVQLLSTTKTVLYEYLLHKGKDEEQVDYYHPANVASLAELNKEFGGVLKSDSVLLLEEKIEAPIKKRKITFKTKEAKWFYAPAGETPKGKQLERFLSRNLNEIFEEKPDNDKLTEKVEKEVILTKKDLKLVKDSQGITWYYVNKDHRSGWIKSTDGHLKEISAYDWDEFGFEILKDTQDKFIYKPESPPKFLESIWSKIDTDNNKILSTRELQSAFKNAEISRKLSHLVCWHSSEWSWGDRWSTLKPEIKELYEEGIDKEEDGALKKQLIQKRDATLDALEARLKNLCFWQEIKNVPPSDKNKEDDKPNYYLPAYNFGGQPAAVNELYAQTGVEILKEALVVKKKYFGWLFGSEPEKKEVKAEANPKRAASPQKPAAKQTPAKPGVFPTGDPKVYHFHPIAFVEQMRRMGSGECECKQFDLIWGRKVSCEFRKKVVEIATNLGLPEENYEGANWLMTVMALESGRTFDPAITNSLGYTGLIQFGSSAAKDLNTTTADLRKMSAVEQLDYVEKYFNKYRSKLKTITDIYLSVLYPIASGHGNDPDYIVFDDDASGVKKTAYKANPLFFHENDEVVKNSKGKVIKKIGTDGGKTFVWEVEKEVKSIYNEGIDNKSDYSDCSYMPKDAIKWHDPIINPQVAAFNFYGVKNIVGSHFGLVRNNGTKNHQGLDLFAPKGTSVYACLDGEVVEANENSGDYGKLVVIKVKKDELLKARNNYKLLYQNQGEKLMGDDYGDEPYRFLRYAHLDEISVSKNNKVSAGQVIGKSGKSGNAEGQSVRARHLHFEITDHHPVGKGLNNRENPAFYVRLNPINESIQINNKD